MIGLARSERKPESVTSMLMLSLLAMMALTGALPVSGGGAQYLEVGTGKAGMGFGVSLAAGDVGGGAGEDLIVGWPVTNAVYVFLDPELSSSAPMQLDPDMSDTVIVGDPGTEFGASVAVIDDIDGDGRSNIAVGAPGTSGTMGAVIIYDAAGQELLTFDGPEAGSMLGMSVAACGDLDGDGKGDILAGAPGMDGAFIVYGDGGPVTHVPDLWAWDGEEGQPVTFTGGVNNTPFDKNSFGIMDDPDDSDDGWDWADGAYGHEAAGAGGSSGDPEGEHHYSAPEPGGADADGITNDGSSRLEVQIGPSRTSPGPSGSPGGLYSAAWGIQVLVGPEAWGAIGKGAVARIGLGWEAEDTDPSGSDDPSYIKARFGTKGSMGFLGTDLGGDAAPDIFYIDQTTGSPAWGPVSGTSSWDVTHLITGPGWYYLDFGAVFDAGSGNQRSNEGIRSYFDNITFRLEGRAVTFEGMDGTGFGSSVVCFPDRDGDGQPEIAIGTAARGLFLFDAPFVRSSILPWNVSYERYSDITSFAPLDIEGDGRTDIAAGTVSGDVLLLDAVSSSPDTWPDMWDWNNDGVIDLDNGLGTSGDTWGPGAGDDGWDTAPAGIYGGSSAQVRYNPGPLDSADGVDRRVERVKELQIELGGCNTGEKPNTPASGAYGIEFDIGQETFDAMKGAAISFDWFVADANGIRTSAEEVWVKARFGTADDMSYLGTQLDGESDPTNEIGYLRDYEAPGQKVLGGTFSSVQLTDLIDGPGTYYLELGGKVDRWSHPKEYMLITFDDISIQLSMQNEILEGDAPVLCGADLDGDGGSDIVHGGVGAVSFTDMSGPMGKFTGDASFAVPFRPAPLAGTNDRDLAVIADPGAGRVTVVGLFMAPSVSFIEPLDGQTVSGTITVRAEITDPLGDPAGLGTEMSIQRPGGDPVLIGALVDGNLSMDTSTVTSGPNTLLLEATNGFGLSTTTSITITIDNVHPPVIEFLSPVIGAVLSGVIWVECRVTDLDTDMLTVDYQEGRNAEEPGTPSGFGAPIVDHPGSDPVWARSYRFDTLEQEDGGGYWFRIRVTDTEGHDVEATWGPFTVDNPRPPEIEFIYPTDGESVMAPFDIVVRVSDQDDDLGPGGATFLGRRGGEPDMHFIGTDVVGENGFYSITWLPEGAPGEVLHLTVEATDVKGYKASQSITVHLSDLSPGDVTVTITSPQTGSGVQGQVPLSALAAGGGIGSLEHRICFETRPTDLSGPWSLIGCGNGSLTWDSTAVRDGEHWLRALVLVDDIDIAVSETVLMFVENGGTAAVEDVSITFLTPGRGAVLRGIVDIKVGTHAVPGLVLVDITLTLVPDTGGAIIIGTVPYDPDGTITLQWDTSAIPNGYCSLSAELKSADGRSWSTGPYGPVEVRNEPPPKAVETDGDGNPFPPPARTTTLTFGILVSAILAFAVTASFEAGRFGLLKYLVVPFIPLYSKLKREKLLDHVLRKRIYKFICENPGEPFTVIKDRMHLKNGVFAYHLLTLEREEFIVSRIDGRFRRFYPMKGVKPPKEIDGLNWFQLGLLETLQRNEGASLKDLAGLMEESPQVVSYHIKMLSLAGFVMKKRKGKRVLHYPVVEDEEMEKVKI